MIKGLPVEEEQKLHCAKLLKGILELSHHTDLVRCKVGPPHQPVKEPIEKELSEFLDSRKINIKSTVTKVLKFAIQACKTTGTRVKFKSFSKNDEPNNPALKKQHTQDVQASMTQLETIQLNIEDDSSFEKKISQYSDSKLDKTENKITGITKELKSVIINFYLSTINIVSDDNSYSTMFSKKLTSAQRFFNSDSKISKSEKNTKIVEARELLLLFEQLEKDTHSSTEDKIKKIENRINELCEKYRTDLGNFSKALKYSSEYLESLKSPALMTVLESDSDEFKAIEKQFIEDVNSYKKVSMRLEPSRRFAKAACGGN